MTYCVYADGNEIETDLSKDEALELELELLDEDPEIIVSIEPMLFDENEDEEDWDEEELEDEDE